MKQSDKEIWISILQDDQAAWKQLVRRYQSLVYTVALRAGLSMTDASDCFQQTWIALYQYRKKIKEPDRLSAWLVTTAKREAIRLSKQSKTYVENDDFSEKKDESLLPDEELEQIEQQSQLIKAISLLDNRCQKLVNLMFFAAEDESYEQIAKKLNVAFNSLGPIRRRCLTRLKKIIKELGYWDVRGNDSTPLL